MPGQLFRNTEDTPIEVVYKFPLPEGSAICGFKAIVEDRVIEGEIEEREKAFELYDKALSEGHGAQLLDEERPNIFTLSVGNIKPKSVVTIEISYVILLDTHGSEIRFYLPTTISPRFTPENQPDQNGIPVTDIVNPPFALVVPYGLNINVDVHDIKGILSIGSASHSINTEFTGNKAAVSFTSETAAMDRDFVLTIVYKNEFVNRGFIFNDHNESFIQIDLMPDEDSATGNIDDLIKEREIVFVLDCSGSMKGESIDEAKKALEIMVKALNPGTLFNIYRFGSSFEHLYKRSKAYNEKEMKATLTYISKTDASLGNTEVLAPLKDIYKIKLEASHHRDIILITDGEISNEAEVLDLAKTHADNTSLHTVGIGNGPNEFLIKGLARSSGGASELIAPNERIEPKILRMFKKVINGGIRNFKVDWNMDIEQAPVDPVLFIGQATSIFTRLKSGNSAYKSIKLSGQTRSGFLTWNIDLTEVNKEDPPVSKLWAREKIRDLEEGNIQTAGSMQRERTDRKYIKTIVEISKQYGIISSETSFIGVEKRLESEKSTSEIVLRKVPVMLTKGWGGLFDRKAVMSKMSISDTPMFSRASKQSNELYCLDINEAAESYVSHEQRMQSSYSTKRSDIMASVLRRSDSLMDILSLQQAEGGFYIDKIGEKLLKLSPSDIRVMSDKIDLKNNGDKLRILMTIIVLLVLELRFWKRKDEWECVVEKSQKWLQTEITKTMPTIDQRPLEEWVRDYLKKRPDIGSGS